MSVTGQESPSEPEDRIPIYKRADCLGAACLNFTGTPCESRLELLEASGLSGGTDLGPLREECDFAAYGRVCTGGEKQELVGLSVESPNKQSGTAELIARSRHLEGHLGTLSTPLEAIVYE